MRSAICLLSFYQRDGLKKNIKTMEAKNDLRHIASQLIIKLYLIENKEVTLLV